MTDGPCRLIAVELDELVPSIDGRVLREAQVAAEFQVVAPVGPYNGVIKTETVVDVVAVVGET